MLAEIVGQKRPAPRENCRSCAQRLWPERGRGGAGVSISWATKSSAGFATSSCGVPVCTSRPSRITAIRSASKQRLGHVMGDHQGGEAEPLMDVADIGGD